MSREDALIRIAAAILANSSINSLNANAADVVMQAHRVVDRILETAPSPLSAAPRAKKRPQDGVWLLEAAKERFCVEWYESFGREHGYPAQIPLWSVGMVKQAIQARHESAVLNGVMP